MIPLTEIKKRFKQVLINSLNTGQINLLGEQVDSKFNVYKVSGYGETMPLPQQTAAAALLTYFETEEDIIKLFTVMLANEGKMFKNLELRIWGIEPFLSLLAKNKWIYDPELNFFFMDPFYEHEINMLKNLRILDLRDNPDMNSIISYIQDATGKLGIKDLDWRITMRLYDLDPKTGELIRKIIEMLLVRQKMTGYTFELFTTLKELAINASKANYKILFEKHITKRQGITAENDYEHFLRLFKAEIEKNGNRNLLSFAKKDDRYYNIIFQSSAESFEIWVVNNETITAIEKVRLLAKLGFIKPNFQDVNEEHAEGAGMGLSLVLSILRKHSKDPQPLKVIFYPGFIKIGFSLKRNELEKK